MAKELYYDATILKHDTVNGHDWAVKTLHPPGAKGASYNGYPDKSVLSAIHSEYRQQFEKTPFTKDETTSCLLAFTPGLFYPLWAAGNVTNGTSNTWRTPYENSQLARSDLGANFSKRRCAYKSTTVELDSTAFTNQGMAFVSEFHPSIDITSYDQALLKYTHCKKSMKVLKDCSDRCLKKEKEIRDKSSNPDDFEDISAAPSPAQLSTRFVQIVKMGRVIKTPTDVTMCSPKSYTGRATEGIFAVQQVNEPTNDWRDLSQEQYKQGVSINGANAGTYLTLYEQLDDAGAARLYYLADSDGTSDNYRGEVDLRGWSWKLVFFQNLVNGGTSGQNPLLAFKIIHGEEWAPSPRGFLNSLAMPPAIYDRQAIDSVSIVTQARQDALPAKYNSLGMLASVASSVAPQLLSQVIQAAVPKPQRKSVEAKIEAAREGEEVAPMAVTQNSADRLEKTEMDKLLKAPKPRKAVVRRAPPAPQPRKIKIKSPARKSNGKSNSRLESQMKQLNQKLANMTLTSKRTKK